MALWERQYYYDAIRTDVDTVELDYLTTNINKMDLETVDYFTVDAATENRIDLISLKFYGNYHFGWLIGLHNNIEDITNGFPIGTRVALPSIDEYYRFYNRNTRIRNGRS